MGIATSYGGGRVNVGEFDCTLTPLNYPRDGTITGVIFCHGSGSGARAASDPDTFGHYALIRGVAERHPVVIGDFAANAWGNAACRVTIEQARIYLVEELGAKPDGVHILAVSMGNVGGLNYAAAFPDNVVSVCSVIGASDPQQIRVDNVAGLRPDIDAAWGVVYPAAAPPENDTMDLAESGLLDGLPYRNYYSTIDTVITPDTVEDLALAMGSSAEAVPITDVFNHSENAVALVTPEMALSFFFDHE